MIHSFFSFALLPVWWFEILFPWFHFLSQGHLWFDILHPLSPYLDKTMPPGSAAPFLTVMYNILIFQQLCVTATPTFIDKETKVHSTSVSLCPLYLFSFLLDVKGDTDAQC